MTPEAGMRVASSLAERETVTVRIGRVPASTPRPTCPDTDVLLPPVAGGYELAGLIGRGGMGVVYKARHRTLDRPVAYKVLTHLATTDPMAVERFRSEATLLAKLQHPHVVQVFDFGTCDGTPYLAMEYVPGGSLAQFLRDRRTTPREATELVATVARAVGHAHDQGIIHRDLNPANILLTPDGQSKVADFGLARDLGGERLTRTGVTAGTPHYMSPEQLNAGDAQTPAVDVWAAGVILYEMLTGTVPFPGRDTQHILTNILCHEAVPPRAWQPDLPRDLETICLKCLQKDPTRRYASGDDLAADLERFLAGQPILARPASRVEKAARWCRRNRAVSGLTAAVAFLLIAGSAVSLGLARWALGEQARAVAAADAEAELRRRAEVATAAEAKARGEAEATVSLLDKLLGTLMPGKDAWAEFRRKTDEAAAALATDGRDPLLRARLLYTLALTRRRLGDLDAAVGLMEQSWALRQQYLPPTDPVYRTTGHQMAYTYYHVDRHEDNLRVLKPLVEAQLAEVPAESAAAIDLLRGLMMAYAGAGRRDEELALGERILALCQKLYGDDHEKTHWIRVNLAQHDLREKRYDRVIPVYERALARFTAHCGPVSDEVVWTRGNLGKCYFHTGQIDRAIPLLRATYERDLAIQGPSHHFTLVSGDYLARAYEKAGRYADAIPIRHALRDHFASAGDAPAAERHARQLADDLAALPR